MDCCGGGGLALGTGGLAAGEVLVLDTVGELTSVYARAAVAFVGGSLVPIGGHNVLEPAMAGRPVVFGPHVANVRHAVEILTACGAGRRIETGAGLPGAVLEWLNNPETASRCGEAGRLALASHRGSAERALALIEAALEPAGR